MANTSRQGYVSKSNLRIKAFLNLAKVSRLALKIVVIARQEARVKKVSAILRFFTQFGFIVFTYLFLIQRLIIFYKFDGGSDPRHNTGEVRLDSLRSQG